MAPVYRLAEVEVTGEGTILEVEEVIDVKDPFSERIRVTEWIDERHFRSDEVERATHRAPACWFAAA